MWASFKILPHQAVAEFESSDETILGWPQIPVDRPTFGFSPIFWSQLASDSSATLDPSTTITSRHWPTHAVHCLCKFVIPTPLYGRADMTIRLGPHYGVRFWQDFSPNPEPDQLASDGLAGSIVRFELLDGDSVLAVAKLPDFFADNQTLVAIAVGYACDYSANTMWLYGRCNKHYVSCGSRTADLKVQIDPERIGTGVATIRNNATPPSGLPGSAAAIEIGSIACHSDPFSEMRSFVMDRYADRIARDTSRIAARCSQATHPTLFLNIGDFVGHPEAFAPPPYGPVSFFATPLVSAIPGQPDSDIAWVAQSTEWRSNCGFSESQNATLQEISIECQDVVVGNLFGAQTFSISGMPSAEYGNNEYVGRNETAEVAAFVSIQGMESVLETNPFLQFATKGQPLLVVVRVRLARRNFFNQVITSTYEKQLTESEANDFFDGTPLEITAAGPAGFPTQTITITPTGNA